MNLGSQLNIRKSRVSALGTDHLNLLGKGVFARARKLCSHIFSFLVMPVENCSVIFLGSFMSIYSFSIKFGYQIFFSEKDIAPPQTFLWWFPPYTGRFRKLIIKKHRWNSHWKMEGWHLLIQIYHDFLNFKHKMLN